MATINASINKAVAKTVKVHYTLDNYLKGTGGDTYDGPAQNWRWYIAYHWYDQTGEEPEGWAKDKDDDGNSTQRLFFAKKCDKVGRHRVSCVAKDRSTREKVDFAVKEQQVEEMGTFLERQMADSKKNKLHYPNYELTMMWKWLILLDGMAKLDGALPTKEIKEAHEKRVKELEEYAEKLKALLNQCGDTIWPFRAVYLAEETMDEQELRVFVTQPKGKKDRVMIVDWTNLDEPKLYGTYDGKFPEWKGRTGAQMMQAGIEAAIATWKSDNRYWKGAIRYEINQKVAGGNEIGLKGDFTTGDTSWTEKAAGILKKIAMGAAMIGLVLTGVGSAWAGAMIVTSMVAGTTGAVLSIHARHAKGENSTLEDALDVLDIISNVLGIGGKAGKAALMWRKGATLEISLAGKAVKAMFIGQVWADGFAGILIGTQFLQKYDQIMSAYMTPDERAKQLLELFGQAAGQGLLHVLNNKVTTAIEEAKWRELAHETSDGVPIHVDDEPTMKGHTDEGEKNVTVVSKQKRQETPKVDAKPKIKPFPPQDDTIWRMNSVTDRSIILETKDGFKFDGTLDHRDYVGIDIRTRKTAAEAAAEGTGETSPHLGSGQENFDRMFHHFESHGHEIKGWAGMFTDANLKAVQEAMAAGATAKEAVFKSITGEKFWVPWAKSKGIKMVVVHATPGGQHTFMFEVKFEKQ